MSELAQYHPAIGRAVQRHRAFFAGECDYLVKIQVPVPVETVPTIAYDDLDWERDFDEYVRGNVENAVRAARARLDLGIEDDSIPGYFPYFGISIHHAFFGGTVHFSHGTSYADPVIDRAAQWRELHADMQNRWLRKLARGLAYCRDHGEGVLVATYRGGNGPLDMANGVMGNNLFTEMFDEPEDMHRVMDVCTNSVLATFNLQRQHNTEIDGGRVVPMGGLWVPGGVIGHVSLDAACLAGPTAYDEFEKPYLERLAAETGGFVIHTHMLGRGVFPAMCATKGILVFAPVNDPNQPTVLEELDTMLEVVGDIPLMLSIPAEQLDAVLPKFRGRRAVFTLSAPDAATARRMLDEVARVLG